MNQETLDRLLADHAVLAWFNSDSPLPVHITGHLCDALVELGTAVPRPGRLPAPPEGVDAEPAVVLSAVHDHLGDAIAESSDVHQMLALGRAGRHVALALQDIEGRPCPALRLYSWSQRLEAIGR